MAEAWEVHQGLDYTVIMQPHEGTDNASIKIGTSERVADLKLANKIRRFLLAPATGWVIKNGDDTKFRIMDQGFFQWTGDLAEAMFFATRASADQAAAEDLDAVFIVKRPIPKEA